MPVNISFGQNIKVFDSGTVIQFSHEHLVLELKGVVDITAPIFLEIRFLISKENSEALIKLENGGTNRLIINLTNYNNRTNHGNVEPIRIGTLDSKELFFSFRVTSAGETFPKTFAYTFYLGEEVQNG
jgi:hypothetical protein